MDAEDKKKLENILRLSEETNEYVKKVRNTQKVSTIFKAVYWVIILSVMFGGFYFIQPYVGSLVRIYSGDLSGIKGASDINGLLNKVK
jgi:hypothetical protein